MGERDEDDAGLTPEHLAALAGADGPLLAGVRLADAEPQTWRAVPEAMETVSLALAVLVPDDATTAERVAVAAEAGAARVLQRFVQHVATFIAAAGRASGLHEGRGTAPASPDATAELVDAAMQFLDGFTDLRAKGAGAPSAALLEVLIDVQAGKGAEFGPTAFPATPSQLRHREAKMRGLAACAMDARMRADPENRRDPAAGHVASILNAGKAQRARRDRFVQGRTVAGWRESAILGVVGKPKGWKAGAALAVWQRYQGQIAAAQRRGDLRTHERWAVMAGAYDGLLKDSLGLPRKEPVREATPSLPERPMRSKR